MKAAFFQANRQRLADELKGGIAVFSAYAEMQRSNDTAFLFEQEANFWWLSGIEAPDWWLIIDGTRGKSWLVAPTLSEVKTVFDGGLTPDEALKASGADDVISQDDAGKLLRDLAKKHSVVYALGDHPHVEYFEFTLNPAPKKMHEMLGRIFNSAQDCRKELAKLRAIKQPEELAQMKKAISLTADAFEEVKRQLPKMKHEYEAEAAFTYYFRSRGAAGHAYDPIVAAGKNACTLHYMQNNAKLKKRELLLLDIGARHGGYAADITRTYALGEPTKRQREVHAAVRDAQAEIIALIVPGLPVEEYQRRVDEIMTRSLMELGLMKAPDDEKAYRHYFPHAISHGLGVDVHDSLGAPRFLRPGMVLTVEPGIYVPEEGIGVRIEDDILVTENGRSNLSGKLSTEL